MIARSFFCDGDAVELTERERNFGVYVLGKSGSGKTVGLQNSALLDIATGKAVVFFDPHGDAARTIMNSIPLRFAEKVCYLDLSSERRPSSGNYFFDRQQRLPSSEGQDMEMARRLWELSERQCGL